MKQREEQYFISVNPGQTDENTKAGDQRQRPAEPEKQA